MLRIISERCLRNGRRGSVWVRKKQQKDHKILLHKKLGHTGRKKEEIKEEEEWERRLSNMSEGLTLGWWEWSEVIKFSILNRPRSAAYLPYNAPKAANIIFESSGRIYDTQLPLMNLGWEISEEGL